MSRRPTKPPGPAAIAFWRMVGDVATAARTLGELLRRAVRGISTLRAAPRDLWQWLFPYHHRDRIHHEPRLGERLMLRVHRVGFWCGRLADLLLVDRSMLRWGPAALVIPGLLLAWRVRLDALPDVTELAAREQAARAADPAAARTWLAWRRLVRDRGTAAMRYELARTVAAREGDDAARSQMRALTIPGRAQDARPHVWLARRLLGPSADSAQLDRAIGLLQAGAGLPGTPDAVRVMLASTLRRRGRLGDALSVLAELAPRDSTQRDALLDVQLRLAGQLARTDPARAAELRGQSRELARVLLPAWQGRLAQAPAAVTVRIRVAHLLVATGRLDAAAQLLDAGLDRRPRESRLGRARGRLAARQARRERRGQQGWETHVRRAAQLAPEEVVEELAWLLTLPGPLPAWARGPIDRLGRAAPAKARLFAAVASWHLRSGERREALAQLEAAHRELPEDAEIAAMLARTLASLPSPDLARALALAERALRIAPGRTDYRGVRGRILLAMGRAREALEDLIAGLPAASDRRAHHRALSTAYAKLGLIRLSQRHAQAAREAAPR